MAASTAISDAATVNGGGADGDGAGEGVREGVLTRGDATHLDHSGPL